MVKYDGAEKNQFTLIMYDPDAPSGTHIHWVVVNISGIGWNLDRRGTTVCDYKGPSPPPGKPHRYIFLLYQQTQQTEGGEIPKDVIEFLKTNGVENVYFTKQGSNRINSNTNTFESQIQLIENYCKENDIFSSRLHTPSGQGLGSGKPRINKLINKWYTLQGANRFNFISNNFNISEFNFSES